MTRLPHLLAVVTLLGAAALAAVAEPMRVGHDFWIGYAGVFIAQDKGFFKDEGVEVELKSFPGPADSLPPLIAGHLDMNLTTLHNLALVSGASDADLKLVYLIDASHGADAIVAKKALPTLKDLEGKKIAVTFNEANHLFLLVALESAGLTEADVELVNVSPDEAGAAFVAGSVDACVTWEPWVTKAMSEGDGHVVYSTKDAPNLIINAIVAPAGTREKRAKDVAAFIRAVDKGVAFLASNPDESLPIIAAALQATPEDVKGMLAGDQIYSIADNRTLLLGEGTPAAQMTLGKIAEFLKAKELTPKPVEPAALIDTTFIKP